VAEPILEARRTEARVFARGEALIVSRFPKALITPFRVSRYSRSQALSCASK